MTIIMILTYGAQSALTAGEKIQCFLRNQCSMFVFSIYVLDGIYDVKLYVQNKCDDLKLCR